MRTANTHNAHTRTHIRTHEGYLGNGTGERHARPALYPKEWAHFDVEAHRSFCHFDWSVMYVVNADNVNRDTYWHKLTFGSGRVARAFALLLLLFIYIYVRFFVVAVFVHCFPFGSFVCQTGAARPVPTTLPVISLRGDTY